MARKNQKNRKRKKQIGSPAGLPTPNWVDDEGMHVMVPGSAPTAKELGGITSEFQKQIRNSPLWDMMVKKFGEKKAAELLKKCRAKLG